MMNYIWPVMIIFSVFCAIATGNTAALSSSILSSGTDAVSLVIRLLGIICLWNGLIHIAEKSGLTSCLSRLISPLLNLLFPNLKDKEAREAISMNITANLLGLDNAATPLGLKAMMRLQKLNGNSEHASDYMVRFVVLNTASLHIFSTTVTLLRSEHGSSSPTEIILPAIITSIASVCVGITLTFVLKRFFK